MSLAERYTISRASSLNGSFTRGQVGPENGYLFFDRKAKEYKAWVAFRQSPQYQNLETQIEQLGLKSSDIAQMASVRNQLLSEEAERLGVALEHAKLNARQTVSAFRERSIGSRLYRLTAKVAQGLAEKIIPIVSAHEDVQRIGRERTAVATEIHLVRQEGTHKQATIEAERRSAQENLAVLKENWLFATSERALFYALTNLGQDSQARNRFLLQYSQFTGQDFAEVQKQYQALADKSRSSSEVVARSDGQVPISAVEITQDIVETDINDPADDNEGSFDFRQWQEFRKSNNTQSNEIGNHSKKKVILRNSDIPVALDAISEEELNKRITASGTPIPQDQLKVIIAELSETADPLAQYQRHPKTVRTGDYKGFYVIEKGKKGRVLFKYVNGEVHIRFGGYFEVYADGKKWQG